TLTLTLSNGILKDAQSRTGYIADNYQFQFDAPPQTGAIYTAGWSTCSNGSLAIGSSAIFYQCLSGTFYNLYWYPSASQAGGQCTPIYIDILPIQASTAASSARPVSQISDGQIQASTAASSARPVSQISDGQIQATTGTARPVSQISDGQIQATTGTARPVSQISDGQIQATTGTARPVSQISDGQIQATASVRSNASTSSVRPVSQISDGQIQATRTNGTIASASATAARYTGAAAPVVFSGELFGLAAGALAVAML
ncbi:hypothetical protein BAUCODRAFT_72654, partial [Baudoinia panamericana UAMH 10762]